MHIGKKIRLLRMSKGWTQGQLASEINKERPLISYIERNGKVNHYTLVKICKALGTSIAELENMSNDPEEFYASGKAGLLKEKDAEIDRLKKELRRTEELVKTQKELIEVLKRGKKGR